ncbi:MAG: alpha/beta fold hydrolase [Xanthomonadaceae bacterium]|nr:alpha/beta fold hydrolase [Xanthomonadaceae bacterium]
MQKRALKNLSALSLALILGFGGYALLNPLLLRDLKHSAELWLGGVRPIWSSAGLSGYKVGSCNPATMQCQCFALIHGLGDQALGWRKFLLDTQKTDWGQKQKWVALNMPLNPKNPSVRAIARQVEEALKPLCTKWTVVGNSFGGWIGAWTAIQYDDVHRLVLIGSAGLKQTRTDTGASYFSSPTVASLKDFLNKAYAHPRNDLSDQTLAIVVEKMKSTGLKSLMESQTSDDDLDHAIRNLKKPVTLIWGEKDQIISPKTGKLFQKLIPRSKYIEISDCGHLPQKECPHDLTLILEQQSSSPLH